MTSEEYRRDDELNNMVELCMMLVECGLHAQPAFAQQQPIQGYGEADKEKTLQELQADRAAERAYNNSLKNIPDKGPTDPWGAVRAPDAPKTAAKQKTKTGATAQ
jgi:hypothetical protein